MEMPIKTYYKIYGFWGLICLVINYIKTQLFFKNVKLIRFPIEIRGKKQIDFGKDLTTGIHCRLEAWPYSSEDKLIIFGNRVEIGDFVHIAAVKNVRLGNHVLLASKVYISDIQHGSYTGGINESSPEEFPRERKLHAKEVCICDNVWIGEGVSVMAGVSIGESSIIGANSVVTHSIPPYTIAVGNPAKVIKQYDFDKKQWVKL